MVPTPSNETERQISMNDIWVSKGLVIDAPWISLILGGQKDWEMRSTGTSHRGWFGLIWKGMGCVYGIARLAGVGDPIGMREMIEAFEHHRIPEEMVRSGAVAKWNRPWFLADVIRLPAPVRYKHPNGAVTWVELSENVSLAINDQIAALREQLPEITPAIRTEADAAQPEPEWRKIGESVHTQGNIDHNHIYLREFFDRFPKDVIGGSNKRQSAGREITISWEGGAQVATDLDGTKKLFRARGWIGSFFKHNGARAGDRVVVEEATPYRYRVQIEKGWKTDQH